MADDTLSSQSIASKPPDPAAHLAAVNAAVGAAAANPGGMTVGSDMAVDGAILAMAGPAAAGIGAFIDAMSGGTNNSGNPSGQTQHSHFTSLWKPKNSPVQKQAPKVRPLMEDTTYAEKKKTLNAANKAQPKNPAVGAGVSVFARSAADRASNTSLMLSERIGITGASMAVPPMGALITPEMAAKLGVNPDLIKEQTYALKVRDNPWGITGQASTKRLEQAVIKGNPNALVAAQTFPKHGMTT